jgi:hypothetical protein
MAEKTTKTSSTKGVINISAMGKAGQMTGLNVGGKESFIPAALKQIGSFALNQYFRSIQLNKEALNKVRNSFGKVLEKDYIRDNTNARERIEKLQDEIVEAHRFMNNPIHMLNPRSKGYMAAEETVNRVKNTVTNMSNTFDQIVLDKTEAVKVAAGITSYAGNSNANQRLHTAILANGGFDNIIFIPNEETGVDDRYINITEVDWDDPNTKEVEKMPDIYNDLTDDPKTEGVNESKLVKYDDFKDNNMFASYSVEGVNGDVFIAYATEALRNGYSGKDMDSKLGALSTNTLTNHVNGLSDKAIQDMFFRIELPGTGKTFAEIYSEGDISLEGISTFGAVEMMKESTNQWIKGDDYNLSPKELKHLIVEISKQDAVERNAGAIAEKKSEEKGIDWDSDLSGTGKVIWQAEVGSLATNDKTGVQYKMNAADEWVQVDASGAPVGTGVYTSGTVYHLTTGDDAINLKRHKPRL